MKTFIKTAAIITAATLALTACSSKTTTPADVQARQDIMQDWRVSSDIMKGMMEKPDTFDAKAFKEQADLINASTKEVWTHFANSENKGGSQDTVWSDAEGFKAKAEAFDAAAAELAAAAQNAQSTADVEAAFGKVGESCGSCHKDYKQK
ncbi:MAG: cytochrome c [Moraxella sp.]|nr:cytochrome c [Moraxella sp.]